jgi:hypothetical protein
MAHDLAIRGGTDGDGVRTAAIGTQLTRGPGAISARGLSDALPLHARGGPPLTPGIHGDMSR